MGPLQIQIWFHATAFADFLSRPKMCDIKLVVGENGDTWTIKV
jgi:hypothetical protein